MKASFDPAGDGAQSVRVQGHVRRLEFDPDKSVFRGMMSTKAGALKATIPVALPLDVRSVQALAQGIDGWLTGAEMCALFDLAKGVPQGYSIVEIGSYKGRSTVCLGWGSKIGNGCKVYAVDTHQGSPEHAHSRTETVGGTLPFFQANVERAGLQKIIVPLIVASEDAQDLVREPVGLLFVDGNHSEAGTDYAAWEPKVIPGGLVAFHDYTGWESVRESVDLLLSQEALVIHDRADSMLICRKV